MHTLDNNDATLPGEGPEIKRRASRLKQDLSGHATVHLPDEDATDIVDITATFADQPSPKGSFSGPLPPRQALFALIIACVSVFFTALDQTVVVTALPTIITDLHLQPLQLDHAAWIISAYLLGFVVVMPLMGRVSDIYGRRRIFLICMGIFGFGSVWCGLAPWLGERMPLTFLSNMGIDISSPGLIWMIAARLIQAIGGGAIVPVSMAIASDAYGQKRLGIALGLIGAVTEAGGVVGPLYGALITQSIGWQWIFYLNVPLVIVIMVAAWWMIPQGSRQKERIDWLGAVLLGISLTCISLGLSQDNTSLSAGAATPHFNVIAIVMAVLFLAAFIIVELNVRWPVVELRLFKRLQFTAASLTSLLVGAALIIAMADIPIFADTIWHSSTLDSGLALLRLTALIPIGAVLGGWLCHRITSRLTGLLGLLFTALGFFLMSRWGIEVDWTQITISTIITGFGFGLVISPISTTALNAVNNSQAGMSSSVVTALRMVGMTLGLAGLTSWALVYFRNILAQYISLPNMITLEEIMVWQGSINQKVVEAAHTVYTTVFLLSMILCLLALIPGFFLWGKQKAEENIEEAALAAGHPVRPLIPTWQPDKRKKRLVWGSSALALLLSITLLFTSSAFASKETSTQTPRTLELQLAFSDQAMTSIFSSQLTLQGGTITNLEVTPTADSGLHLSFNLVIDFKAIKHTIPISVDGTMSVNEQHNLHMTVKRVTRDGVAADPLTTAAIDHALNTMLEQTVMSQLTKQFPGLKILDIHSSNTLNCNQGTQMFILHVEIPEIQGLTSQNPPMTICLNHAVDLNTLKLGQVPAYATKEYI